MTDKINKLDDALAAIVKGYKSRIDNPNYIKQELVNTHGLEILDDKNAPLFNQKAAELKNSLYQNVTQELARMQREIKETHQGIEAARARSVVRMTNGRNLARKYADQNQIHIDEAIQELEGYASRKRKGFNPDFLPDQYAALRNLGHLTEDADIKTANSILSKQLEIAEPAEARQERENLARLSSMDPQTMIGYYSGSGYAVSKMIRSNN